MATEFRKRREDYRSMDDTTDEDSDAEDTGIQHPQSQLNGPDTSNVAKKKKNGYDWEFQPSDGESNAPEKRLIELYGALPSHFHLIDSLS